MNTSTQKPILDRTLTDLYEVYVSELDQGQWPWEKARWYELVFCILNATFEKGGGTNQLRPVVEILVELDLLSIDSLSGVPASDWTLDEPSSPLIVTLRTILEQSGFSRELAQSALGSICEAAILLQEKYDGKIQHCLRSHGKQMLEQIGSDFGLTDTMTTHRGLAIWLQNVLNLPVPQAPDFVLSACENLGFTYEELVAAADEEDMNVTLLDDALRVYVRRKKEYLEETGV